jgi:peroxiredoxin family protein/TusA-related sulfurtransferase
MTDLNLLVVDCRGLQCPAPIMRVADTARQHLASPRVFAVLATDPDFAADLDAWCRATRARVLKVERSPEGVTRAEVAMAGALVPSSQPARATPASARPLQLDLRGATTTAALLRAGNELADAGAVDLAIDPQLEPALTRFGESLGARLSFVRKGNQCFARMSVEPALAAVPTPVPQAAPAPEKEQLTTLLIVHNDIESMMAALMVANASAATGARVEIFFSFWAVTLLRSRKLRSDLTETKRSFLDRLMGWMLPRGPGELRLSQFHFGGLGRRMLLYSMRRKHILNLEQLLDSAVKQGVGFAVCSMSMGLCGVSRREIVELPGLRFAGVTAFVEGAQNSSTSLVF